MCVRTVTPSGGRHFKNLDLVFITIQDKSCACTLIEVFTFDPKDPLSIFSNPKARTQSDTPNKLQ